jgi:O-acetyl-ADP-ribose deacetylase (regulator of RNase III)
MEKIVSGTALRTIVGDITTLEIDAIVNAANSSLMGGGGVDGAIHRAGGPSILEECKQIIASIGRLPTGEAVITSAGNMPSKYVIHTVGPVWRGGRSDEPELLENCYRNCLMLAMERGIRAIAFPSISTGVYGYPVQLAAGVAVKTVVGFVEANPDKLNEVIFCGFDAGTEREYARALGQ